MKLFRLRGGVHLDYRKDRTKDSGIVPLPMPGKLYIPLQQHVGMPADLVVSIGDTVRKGQLLAAARATVSAPIHAPTSGRVAGIVERMAPHPSGLTQQTLVLEADGRDQWDDTLSGLDDPFAAPPQDIARRVAEAGIVGLGGATFPSAIKLGLGKDYALDCLLLNGAECEPYLTCDDRVMREHAAEVVDGARIMARALGTPQVIIAIEANKPEALAAMAAAAAPFATPPFSTSPFSTGALATVTVVPVPVRYPMGSERHLTKAVTGRETPAHALTASVGVVVQNVATARAVHHAIRSGRPLVARVVTVSGKAMARAHNIDVPIGALMSDVIAFCGGLSGTPQRIITGGPMMGQPLPSLDVPVVKGTSGILALTAEETNEGPAGPCIRCGACVSACPCGLMPLQMTAFVRKEDLDNAARSGVMDCVSCGSCSYICPSHIPLVQYFNYAKGRINALDRERRKNERIKSLAEARRARLERIARAKREALAARRPPAAAAPSP
jgi:electron transport complex protein RnfC